MRESSQRAPKIVRRRQHGAPALEKTLSWFPPLKSFSGGQIPPSRSHRRERLSRPSKMLVTMRVDDPVEEKPVNGQRGTMPGWLYERIFPLRLFHAVMAGVYEAPKP